MKRQSRPDWAWMVYTAWRRRSPEAMKANFEFAGWFKRDDAWCRQNEHGQRIEVRRNGAVTLLEGVTSWI